MTILTKNCNIRKRKCKNYQIDKWDLTWQANQ